MKSIEFKIFGYDWECIKAAQRKECRLADPLPKTNPAEAKAKIESDIKRFSIPVADEVRNAYGIELPANYTLHQDGFWRTS